MDDGAVLRVHEDATTTTTRATAAIAKPSARRAAILVGSDLVWLLAFCHAGASLVLPGLGTGATAAISSFAACFSILVFFSLGLYGRDAMYSDPIATGRLTVAGIFDFVAFYFVLVVGAGLDQGGRAYLGLLLAVMAGHAAAFGARLAIVHRFRLPVMRRRLLVVGGGERAERLRRLVGRSMRHEVEIVGVMPAAHPDAGQGQDAARPSSSPGRGLFAFVRDLGIDEIVIAADDRRDLPLEDLLRCKTEGVRVRDDTRFLEEEAGYVDTVTATAGWFVFGGGFARSAIFHLAKRVFDVVVATLVLGLTSPLLVLAAIAIRVDSRGPIFYRQERAGLGGRSFTLVKFRSMRVDAEAAGPRWAALGDSRVTRVGRFLRATRIDELPQLANVLAGSMSFVGPRPERPVFVEALERVLPFYAERHRVKPGITGWAQINYPYGASLDDAREKLAFDLYYVKNAGLLLDLLILLQTLRVVLFQTGAR